MMRRRNEQYVGFGNSKKRTPIGDYAADAEKWQAIEQKTIKMINDEDMMGVKWEKAAKNRKSPTPKWQAPAPGGPAFEWPGPKDIQVPAFPGMPTIQ